MTPERKRSPPAPCSASRGTDQFGDDIEGWRWQRLGVHFDQANALLAVALAFPTNLPPDAPRSTVPDLVDAPIAELYARLLSLDPTFVTNRAADDLGVFWCRDPANVSAARSGHAEPRAAVDLDTGAFQPGP